MKNTIDQSAIFSGNAPEYLGDTSQRTTPILSTVPTQTDFNWQLTSSWPMLPSHSPTKLVWAAQGGSEKIMAKFA
jgi:hypothetical protein